MGPFNCKSRRCFAALVSLAMVATTGCATAKLRAPETGGKLLLTRGISTFEGSGGGALTPWALITGNGTDRGVGATAHYTYVKLRDFDLQTFGGMPKPTGAIDLKLVGGNGLLDKLVAMGFVPEAQAMQARLMLGLFAVPGEAPDTLTSRLEVNEQGHVLANGQRIQ